MKNRKYFIVVSLIIIALFSISLVKKTLENDTYFSIAVGNKILEQGFYEDEDFTWHEGLKFPNVRWIFDVSVALINKYIGLQGIYYALLITVAILGCSLFYILNKLKVNKVVSLLGTLLIVYMSHQTFLPRALTYSFLIFIWQYYLITRLLETNKKRYSIILILLSVLLANLHSPVFLIYVAMFLPHVAECILVKTNILKDKDTRLLVNKDYKYGLFFITLIISACGGIFAPNHLSSYTDALKAVDQSVVGVIAEMHKVELIDRFEYLSIAILALCMMIFTKTKIRVTDLLYLIGFGAFGLTANRSIFFFIMIGGIAVIRMFDDICNEYGLYELKINDGFKSYFFILFSIFIIIYSINSLICNLHEDLVAVDSWCPEGAAEYILNNLDPNNTRLYNSFNDGGYLEFRGIKVFLDSRAELYLESFNKTTVLDDYVNMSYFDLQSKYNFTHLLFNQTDEICNYVLHDPDYKVVYSDDNYILFEYDKK